MSQSLPYFLKLLEKEVTYGELMLFEWWRMVAEALVAEDLNTDDLEILISEARQYEV